MHVYVCVCVCVWVKCLLGMIPFSHLVTVRLIALTPMPDASYMSFIPFHTPHSMKQAGGDKPLIHLLIQSVTYTLCCLPACLLACRVWPIFQQESLSFFLLFPPSGGLTVRHADGHDGSASILLWVCHVIW